MADIIKYPDETLNKHSLPVEKFDEDLTKLFAEMEHAMKAEGGIGISAIQIGVPLRAMIIGNNKGELTRIVNPIIDEDPECPKVYLREGCLSLPGISVLIWRPEHCSVKFQNEKGDETYVSFMDWDARVFLHEYDHLEGLTILDRVSKITRSSLLAKYKKANR
jgi:peptide deformylase